MNRLLIVTFASLLIGTHAIGSSSMSEAMQRFPGKYESVEGSKGICQDLGIEIDLNYSDARKGNKRLIISKLQTKRGELLSRKFFENDLSGNDLNIKYGIRNYGTNAYIIFDYSSFDWISNKTSILELDLDEQRELMKVKVKNSSWSLTTTKPNKNKVFECELKKI